ncbi:hypothetical protein ACN47E_003275 [Coniothyrium glycines]
MRAPVPLTIWLVLASAAVAQQETPSVVTAISITPTPASEEVFTIQTSVPGSVEGSMGIPPGETPISPIESIASIITDPLLSTVTGIMSIPPGETPISIFTGSLDVSAPPSATSGVAPTTNASASTSAPPEQTTNAAVTARAGTSLPLLLAAVFAML